MLKVIVIDCRDKLRKKINRFASIFVDEKWSKRLYDPMRNIPMNQKISRRPNQLIFLYAFHLPFMCLVNIWYFFLLKFDRYFWFFFSFRSSHTIYDRTNQYRCVRRKLNSTTMWGRISAHKYWSYEQAKTQQKSFGFTTEHTMERTRWSRHWHCWWHVSVRLNLRFFPFFLSVSSQN